MSADSTPDDLGRLAPREYGPSGVVTQRYHVEALRLLGEHARFGLHERHVDPDGDDDHEGCLREFVGLGLATLRRDPVHGRIWDLTDRGRAELARWGYRAARPAPRPLTTEEVMALLTPRGPSTGIELEAESQRYQREELAALKGGAARGSPFAPGASGRVANDGKRKVGT